MTRQLCDISFDDAEARQIVVGEAAAAAVDAGLAAGAAVLAAEQLGLAQRCLDLTVAYVKERRQFARPVGSFQALKHRLADLWTTITLARAASRYAAACLADDDPDAPVAIALAKSACCEAAVLAAEEMVQLHGGIGFTWEHPAHLYLKRAKAASVTFGTPGAHLAALAALVDLPAPGAVARRRPLDPPAALPLVLAVLGRLPIGVRARVGSLRPVGVTAALGGHGVPSGRPGLGRQVRPGRRVRLAARLGIADSTGARLGVARPAASRPPCNQPWRSSRPPRSNRSPAGRACPAPRRFPTRASAPAPGSGSGCPASRRWPGIADAGTPASLTAGPGAPIRR